MWVFDMTRTMETLMLTLISLALIASLIPKIQEMQSYFYPRETGSIRILEFDPSGKIIVLNEGPGQIKYGSFHVLINGTYICTFRGNGTLNVGDSLEIRFEPQFPVNGSLFEVKVVGPGGVEAEATFVSG